MAVNLLEVLNAQILQGDLPNIQDNVHADELHVMYRDRWSQDWLRVFQPGIKVFGQGAFCAEVGQAFVYLT